MTPADAASVIISDVFDDGASVRGTHPDDVRVAFEAVADELAPPGEPTHVAVETDRYYLSAWGAGQTSHIESLIADALPDDRAGYGHPRDDEYVRILAEIVRQAADVIRRRADEPAPGGDMFLLAHPKP